MSGEDATDDGDTHIPSVLLQRGAYAALHRHARDCPDAASIPHRHVCAWYAGFDKARRRMAMLEGELVRGEKP